LLLTLAEKLHLDYILNDNSCYDVEQVINHDESHTVSLNDNNSFYDDDQVGLSPKVPINNVTLGFTSLPPNSDVLTKSDKEEPKPNDNFCLFNKIGFQTISLALIHPNSVERHGKPTSMLVITH
jgi:hypothetical protein